MAFFLGKREREKTICHLKKAFGETFTPDQIYLTAKNTFLNLGRNAAELFLWETYTPQKLRERIDVEGFEHVYAGLKQGKGVLIVTGHCGNWELMPAFVVVESGCEGSVIVRTDRGNRLNDLINSMRLSKGFGVIDRDESPRKILRQLRSNKIIGILPDQDIKRLDGVFVDFFGYPAYTPTAPVVIALASGCALVPAVIIRDRNCKMRHKLVFYPPIELNTNRKDKTALVLNTQKWTTILENHIRQYPDQWVWMHKRWKTTPESLKGRRA